MNVSKDQRFFPRAAISLQVDIEDGESRSSAQLVDLTVQGFSFKGERSIPEGAKFFIEIGETKDIRKNKLPAQALRCNPLNNTEPLQYQVAAKFIDVNDEYLMDVLDLIHRKIKMP